jgi:hypothetical protein
MQNTNAFSRIAEEGSSVAVVRRTGVRTVLGLLLATLALGSLTQTAVARPYCDGPHPPPICDRFP